MHAFCILIHMHLLNIVLFKLDNKTFALCNTEVGLDFAQNCRKYSAILWGAQYKNRLGLFAKSALFRCR